MANETPAGSEATHLLPEPAPDAKPTAKTAPAKDPPPFSVQGYLPSAYRRPEYVEYLEKATHAMKTIKLVVYAGMTAFFILSVYGFYLIYRLTSDVHMAVQQTTIMTQQMQSMSRIMANMEGSVSHMDGNMDAMNTSITRMNQQLGQLGDTVALMQHSARNLDQSIGPVMGTMNRMIPFGWTGNNYPGAPPYAPPMR